MAKISLERDFYEVYEVGGPVGLDVCVILKTPIKRNITFHLDYANDSAIGEQFNILKKHALDF